MLKAKDGDFFISDWLRNLKFISLKNYSTKPAIGTSQSNGNFSNEIVVRKPLFKKTQG
jgi:hypothetical protein